MAVSLDHFNMYSVSGEAPAFCHITNKTQSKQIRCESSATESLTSQRALGC